MRGRTIRGKLVSLVSRWLHVVAAITWIGGMLFIALVLVPVTRRLEDTTLRARLVHAVGLRFRTVGWIALAVLTLVLSAFHDFVLGPRAGAPGADPSARVRASWIARLNVLVVLVIVLLGLSLLR